MWAARTRYVGEHLLRLTLIYCLYNTVVVFCIFFISFVDACIFDYDVCGYLSHSAALFGVVNVCRESWTAGGGSFVCIRFLYDRFGMAFRGVQLNVHIPIDARGD